MKATKFTVMVVEDDEDERAFLRADFQSFASHYRIHTVANGNEAIAYLKGEGKYSDRAKFEFPSYIITDLKMFPGDGFDVLDFIKKNPALSIVAIHHHMTHENPRHIFLHYWGKGKALDLAKAVKQALDISENKKVR